MRRPIRQISVAPFRDGLECDDIKMNRSRFNLMSSGSRVHAKSLGDEFSRLALKHPAYQFGSTMRRKPGILMHVHPVLLGISELCNSSFLGLDRMDDLLRAHN